MAACLHGVAQPTDTTGLGQRTAQTLQQLEAATTKANDKITATTTKALDQLNRQQQKVYKQLKKIDSLAAADWLAQGKAMVNKVEAEAKAKLQSAATNLSGPYLPRLDSLQTMLGFLQQPGTALQNNAAVGNILAQTRQLQSQLGNLQQLQQQLEAQKANLTQLLSKYTNLPKALLGQLKKYNGQLATYKAQVEDWKAMLNQPERLEREALKWLGKLPAFQKFMQQNSQLAQLFGAPGAGGAGGGQALAGLQTQQSVSALLQQRFGAGAQQQIQQQLQAGIDQLRAAQANPLGQATAQLQQLRTQATNVVNQAANGTVGNAELTPYQQDKAALKSKPFLQRFETGYNLQTATRNGTFPSVNDVGLSLGYKLNPRSVVGVGLAYKFGMGTWQKIQVTHEGIGLRTYVDWKFSVSKSAKLFQNFWLSGGFEMNYFQRFSRLPNLQSYQWQKSGLIGLTKKIPFKNPRPNGRAAKTASIQILYDFLRQKTNTGELPVVVRWGWGL